MKKLFSYAVGMMLFMPLISCEDSDVSACKQCYVAMTALAVDSTEAVYGYHSAAQAEADFRDIYAYLDTDARAEVRRFVSQCKASARSLAIHREAGERELNQLLNEED